MHYFAIFLYFVEFVCRLLARIFKVGLGGCGGMLPQKILNNWSLLDVISAILTAVNVFQFTY